MCDPDISFKKLNLFIDANAKKHDENRSYYEISSKTNFIDQMVAFAKIRKGSGEREEYGLNAIAIEELGEDAGKEEVVEDMKQFPYVDFANFIKYGIKDSLILYKLEQQNGDIDLLHSLAEITRTRVNKVLTKTVSLRNYIEKYLFDNDYILSNNKNADYSSFKIHNSGKFKGAYVLNTSMMSETGIQLYFNKRSALIFDSVIDMDLSSMYPSIILGYNIESSVQLGKIDFTENMPEFIYSDNIELLIESFVERNYVNFGNQWLGLPDHAELIDIMQAS
jgi:DNA polymerase elongation subunit (family B)